MSPVKTYEFERNVILNSDKTWIITCSFLYSYSLTQIVSALGNIDDYGDTRKNVTIFWHWSNLSGVLLMSHSKLEPNCKMCLLQVTCDKDSPCIVWFMWFPKFTTWKWVIYLKYFGKHSFYKHISSEIVAMYCALFDLSNI